MNKERLDVRMTGLGLAASREKARNLIKEGKVYVSGLKVLKPGQMVREEDPIEVRGEVLPYVSRGGLKMEKAIDAFGLDLTGLVCIDAGASTGGFTDCMLQHGAAKVYAVDVGTDQLAPKLKEDTRVISLEQTNVRYLDETMIPELCDLASFDLSFISLEKVIPAVCTRLKENGRLICLVKPQFEAGPSLVGKRGVVKDAKVHISVLRHILTWCREQGLSIQGLTWSPIKGPEGNIEYLLYLSRDTSLDHAFQENGIPELVRSSHEAF